MDQSKKTMRHFYCRDVLWETFEQMANDFDCSIDYLINEAMRYYARSKNYQSAAASQPSGRPPAASGAAPRRFWRSSGLQNARTSPPPGKRPDADASPPGSTGSQRTPAQPAAAPRRPQPPAPGPGPALPVSAPPTLLIQNSQKTHEKD
jgi:hypothetical protein